MDKKRSAKGRKSRTKAKKPKFLSLRLQFPANKSDEIKQTSEMPSSNSKQLNVLSLHPEINQLEDRDSNDHENDVAFFFSAADGGATSLTGLLDTSTAAASVSSHINNNNNNSSRLEDLSPSSASLTYAYGGQVREDRAALVRNALRNRERDSSEDKWVCYSEVVKEEEVTSSAFDRAAQIRRPSLKLDYEEILNAWSNKGPLYIDSESSQIVPDVNDDDDFLSHQESNHGTMSWGCNNVGVWTVPEMVGEIENGEMRMKREDELKMGQREASVLRYKEKRRNRLFSRTIRYQVRKLNAEKRPRLKGRFVKRSQTQ